MGSNAVKQAHLNEVCMRDHRNARESFQTFGFFSLLMTGLTVGAAGNETCHKYTDPAFAQAPPAEATVVGGVEVRDLAQALVAEHMRQRPRQDALFVCVNESGGHRLSVIVESSEDCPNRMSQRLLVFSFTGERTPTLDLSSYHMTTVQEQ